MDTQATPGTTEEPDDDELVRRIRAGEGALYEILMRRYNQRLFRVARAIVRDAGEAEDVMQQAYVNAYLNLHQFAERARFSTWLTRIAVHEALARVRRRQRREGEMPEQEPAAPGPDPEQVAAAGELRALLEGAVDALPDAYRTVFVLREVEGLSTAETAASLDLGEEAVKTRLFRSRALLRAELWERAGAAAPAVFGFHLSRCDAVVRAVMARLELSRA